MVASSGHCLCGKVSYRLADAPSGYGACHCEMCRRFSGGIELGVQVPPGGVTYDDKSTLRTFTSSEWAERGFCGECGSSLFWRMTAPGPMQGMTVMCAGTLDNLDGLELTSEVYIDHKPDGHAFAGERHRMTEREILIAAGFLTEDEA